MQLEISNIRDRERHELGAVRVSTTSMLSWIPASSLESTGIHPERVREFQREDGSVFTRLSAPAILYVMGRATVDDVIVCEPGDEPKIGWHTLSGWNLRLDTAGNLVDCGPIPAAAVAA